MAELNSITKQKMEKEKRSFLFDIYMCAIYITVEGWPVTYGFCYKLYSCFIYSSYQSWNAMRYTYNTYEYYKVNNVQNVSEKIQKINTREKKEKHFNEAMHAYIDLVQALCRKKKQFHVLGHITKI